MIDAVALLRDLKAQVRQLENDLRERAANEFDANLRAEWRAAREAERTSAPYESALKNSWLDDRITQAAVAWVLGTVFVRFCEDNGLIDLPYLAGLASEEHGSRLAVAKERQAHYWNTADDPTDRGWVEQAFKALAVTKVTAGLFDRAHNPMWTITPSHEAAKRLLAFWRETGEDGEIRHDFTDKSWNTRFLGDLYEELSEHAQDTYALRQTPDFIERFILDYTLTPALEEFGLSTEFRLIDPTCGSGHFLLDAFHRLLNVWERQAPAIDRWELIARSLKSVHGVDKNPFAAVIARFRLLTAAMRAGGIEQLTEIRGELVINVAIGDSLLHGEGGPQISAEIPGLFNGRPEEFSYRTEDVFDYMQSCNILKSGSYHVVIGNPPYIQVKDKHESDNYRKSYTTCYRQYQLVVPFAERFFHLAKRGLGDMRDGGYVGQITGNGFMKREFGKKLIEEFFSGADPHRSPQLTHIIDTSAAYIPGHPTPTVILIGRNNLPLSTGVIRTVVSIKGQAQQPKDPSTGEAWQAIIEQISRPDEPNEWVSVTDAPRDRFITHPWSLGGREVEALSTSLVKASGGRLGQMLREVGLGSVTREDSAYMLGRRALSRQRVPESLQRALVEGDTSRDWRINDPLVSIWPYEKETLNAYMDDNTNVVLWPYRAILRERVAFGKSQLERGLAWFEYSMFFRSRFLPPLKITLPTVATHNHFSIDRNGVVFKDTLLVLVLKEEKNESIHLSLLGILNSSTACFWLKHVSHDKGSQSGTGGFMHDEWERFRQYNGKRVAEFPVPAKFLSIHSENFGTTLTLGRALDSLAQQISKFEPTAVCGATTPTRQQLDAARSQYERVRSQMIALQEELDWAVYHLYDLLDESEAAELTAPVDVIPEVTLGERAFEIVLARQMSRGAETQWFKRHGSTAITEIPDYWPEAYRKVVEKRIETIERRARSIGLIERPECKRRWAIESWEKREKEALRNWLLDRCEDRSLWFAPDDLGKEQPRPITVSRLADRLGSDPDFVAVARLYGGDDAKLVDVIAEIVETEHVPYLGRLRYKPSGLVRRAQWERTWELQREEDRTGQRLNIDVPDRYSSGDFLKPSYWRNRGKLDVPKERFISYPLASPDTDDSLLLGWAGWDHLQQAHALYLLLDERRFRDGWTVDRVKPLLAGLAEVLPWVWQWHGERDAEGQIPAQGYAEYLEEQQRELRLTADDLAKWEPPQSRRGQATRK
ncbi:BREX-2 system adenine-specific DNA-methyltransferase PglX [Nonomuraea fuscirosea]|uniref:BREX-2 system adenine-specific DNA-methyltransferase PglX n=1 Tax=Nonomuraea fuscirosea TaxID=1291556 RepID=UPI0033C4212E